MSRTVDNSFNFCAGWLLVGARAALPVVSASGLLGTAFAIYVMARLPRRFAVGENLDGDAGGSAFGYHESSIDAYRQCLCRSQKTSFCTN